MGQGCAEGFMKDWKENTRSTFATLGASTHSDHDREENDYYATSRIKCAMSTAEQKALIEDVQRHAADEFVAHLAEQVSNEENAKGSVQKRWDAIVKYLQNLLSKLYGERVFMPETQIRRAILDSKRNLSNKTTFSSVYDSNGITEEYTNTGQSVSNGSTTSRLNVPGRSTDSDRRYIRVFEDRMVAEQFEYNGKSERAKVRQVSQTMIEVAKELGMFIPASDFSLFGAKHNERTVESIVYINPKRNVVTKVKTPFAKPPMKSSDVRTVIYEHIAHNYLFPDTPYTFKGIAEIDGEARLVYE